MFPSTFSRQREYWCLICAVNSIGDEKTSSLSCDPSQTKNMTTIWPSHSRTRHASSNCRSDSQTQKDKGAAATASSQAPATGSTLHAFFGPRQAPAPGGVSAAAQKASSSERRDTGRVVAKHDALRDMMTPVFAELQLSYRSVEKPKFRNFITSLSGGRYSDAVRC